jgi:SAM-dependent methyltransferase
MNPRTSLPPAYFDRLYAADPDPWRFATSDYERAKYQDTLHALGPRRFRSALEVGCSIGILTRQLAERVDALLAIDVVETALAQDRRRCADVANVRFVRACVPQGWPDGAFDLILFSEVLYYLSPADIGRTAAATLRSFSPDGTVLLVHWTGATNYPCSGDEAAELFIADCVPHLRTVTQERRPEYRLDRLQPI